MKKGILLVLFLIISFTSNTSLAKETWRVAVLPAVNSSYNIDKDTELVINEALGHKTRMLLNKRDIRYEIIPSHEIKEVLPQELKALRKPAKLNAALVKDIGEKLKADIIIGAQIANFRTGTVRKMDDDVLTQTDLTIHVVYYDAAKNKFLDIHDNRRYYGEWAKLGDPKYLAKQSLEHLFNKLALNIEK